jgi:acyl-CoA thioesterase I
VANQLGLPTIDVYAPLLDHPEYFFDGVHPNNEGSIIIAEKIYSAVLSDLPSPS